jgi:hypothetical protein
MPTSSQQSGFLIASVSRHTDTDLFQLVSSIKRFDYPGNPGILTGPGGLRHWVAADRSPVTYWGMAVPFAFGHPEATGAAVIQSNYGGNLEVVARVFKRAPLLL